MWAFLVSAVLVTSIGFASQRGNTCTVAAVDDLVHRRSPSRLLALVYTWAIIAGGLALLDLASPLKITSGPVTGWCLLGGALLGAGAVVNGSCTTGTVCRVGSGEYKFLMTVVGFFLGCLIAPNDHHNFASDIVLTVFHDIHSTWYLRVYAIEAQNPTFDLETLLQVFSQREYDHVHNIFGDVGRDLTLYGINSNLGDFSHGDIDVELD